MMNEPPQQTLLVVTGASRGLGRAIAIAFASSTQIPSLRALLVARSADDLAETAALMRDAAEQSSTEIDVSYVVADLSKLSSLELTIEKLVLEPLASSSSSLSKEYDKAVLINNAGSLGYLGRVADMSSLAELQHAINFNITSSIWLSSQFARKFALSKEGEAAPAAKCIIVNISSLCAIKPFNTMSVYCAGKAARDMFHAVLSKEESAAASSAEDVKILNYAPGMCETEMSVELAESDQLDQDLSAMYQTSLEEKKMVQPKDTAEKLLRILLADDDEWNSGAHIDYWDE